MNWINYWQKHAEQGDLLSQVGRIRNGKPMPKELLEKITGSISHHLQLKPTDEVLDVCCGNGSLSYQVASFCRSLTAIDFSETLLDNARQFFQKENISYLQANALDFDLDKKFDNIYLYFSFQYFETEAEGKRVIENCLSHLQPKGKLFIGDIPDKNRWWNYHNSLRKIIRALKQKISGKYPMGKFWSEKELGRICNQLSVKGQIIKQQDWQPYSNYRFDYLIYKSEKY